VGAKHPSKYIQCIFTREGTVTGNGNGLPRGVQSMSIAKTAETPKTTEIPKGDDVDCDYALSTSIPTGTKPHNKWEAHRSPDWPHW